jgi:putative flippase GtrA
LIQQFLSKQFLLFLATGGTAALVNFCSRIFYDHWVSFSSAIILAYLTGMVTAFLLARFLVFKQSQHSFSQSALIFTAVNLVAVLQTWFISMGLALYVLPSMGVTHWVAEIAHAVGIVSPAFTSYLGHKYLTFRK